MRRGRPKDPRAVGRDSLIWEPGEDSVRVLLWDRWGGASTP